MSKSYTDAWKESELPTEHGELKGSIQMPKAIFDQLILLS